MAEMPSDDEPEDEQQLGNPQSCLKRETRTSECGGSTPLTPPVLLTCVPPGSATQMVTPGTSLGEQSRAATPATFLSESTGSPAIDPDDDPVDEEDPNDPEWEGSEGSAPKSSGALSHRKR